MKSFMHKEEFSLFTVGVKKITPEALIKIIDFQNGTSQLRGLFKKYLEEAIEDCLVGFLKFTTGRAYFINNLLTPYHRIGFCTI